MTLSLFASLRSKLFGHPNLPSGLRYLVMLLIFTQFCTLLMNQPAAYWLNPQSASTDWPFRFLLLGGPLTFLAILGIYLISVRWLLVHLHVPAGLFLAAMLGMLHAVALFRISKCGFYPLYETHSAWACYTYRFTPLILFFILFGLSLFIGQIPAHRVEWGKKFAVPLIVLWVCLMGYGIFRAAFAPASPWKALVPAHSPGPRSMAAIAYDNKRQRAVLFGGVTVWDGKKWVYDNSTWEWDGHDWQQMETSVAPTGRILHAMAYDEVRGKVILYGGQNTSGNLADLWEWDGVTWHRLCPVCNPAARFGHKMIFDVGRQQIVVYGGQDGKTGFAQAWSWDGAKWDFFQFESAAPAVYNAPLIYDQARDRTISFMGGMWGGTWVWEASRWHKLDPAVAPSPRDEAVLAYDPNNDYTLLFGGVQDNRIMFNDTWILNDGTWAQIDTPVAPPQRNKAVAFYDPVRHSIIVYGGENVGSLYTDMWEFVLTRGK